MVSRQTWNIFYDFWWENSTPPGTNQIAIKLYIGWIEVQHPRFSFFQVICSQFPVTRTFSYFPSRFELSGFHCTTISVTKYESNGPGSSRWEVICWETCDISFPFNYRYIGGLKCCITSISKQFPVLNQTTPILIMRPWRGENFHCFVKMFKWESY